MTSKERAVVIISCKRKWIAASFIYVIISPIENKLRNYQTMAGTVIRSKNTHNKISLIDKQGLMSLIIVKLLELIRST